MVGFTLFAHLFIVWLTAFILTAEILITVMAGMLMWPSFHDGLIVAPIDSFNGLHGLFFGHSKPLGRKAASSLAQKTLSVTLNFLRCGGLGLIPWRFQYPRMGWG
jgi:hypothetical protein